MRENMTLTSYAHKLGISGIVVRSDCDSSARYLLNQGRLPMIGLGWTMGEARQELEEHAALYGREAE